MEDREECIVAG